MCKQKMGHKYGCQIKHVVIKVTQLVKRDVSELEGREGGGLRIAKER